MLIQLSRLKPNPERDFKVDPLDQAAVEALVASIVEDGFWGGVTARPSATGGYEIAAGHHRVEAARRAGLTEAEIFVGDFDDQTMVRIYSKENGLQRNNKATSIDGAVLAAVRYLTRILMGGICGDFTTDGLFESEKAFDVARGTLLKGDGIGRKLILRVLGDTPGMTENCIKDSLARLKASGDYARTLAAIHRQLEDEAEAARLEAERLEREQREAEARAAEERHKAEELERQRREAIEKAEAERLERQRQVQERRHLEEQSKAQQLKVQQEAAEKTQAQKDAAAKSSAQVATKVSGQKVTFDLSGVSAYLVNTHQVNAFRKLAETESQYLPVGNQAALAKALKEEAARQKTELSASFIQQHFVLLLMDAKQKERTFASKEKEARFNAASFQEKNKKIQEEIARYLRGANSEMVNLMELQKKAPAHVAISYRPSLRRAIAIAADLLCKLNKEFSL